MNDDTIGEKITDFCIESKLRSVDLEANDLTTNHFTNDSQLNRHK